MVTSIIKLTHKEMNNEKELTEQETAPKPKKQTKKKAPKQETTTEPEPQVTQPEPDAPNSTPSVNEDTAINQNDLEYHTPSEQENQNWNFYNQLQNVQPKSSNGGSNHTPSVRRNAQKRIRKAKTQRASRRINRKK